METLTDQSQSTKKKEQKLKVPTTASRVAATYIEKTIRRGRTVHFNGTGVTLTSENLLPTVTQKTPQQPN